MKIKEGTLCIINEYDRPCCELVCRVKSIQKGKPDVYVCEYVTEEPMSNDCADIRPIPLSEFGVEVVIDETKQTITTKQTSPSKATYSDGRPREWQPQDYDQTCNIRANMFLTLISDIQKKNNIKKEEFGIHFGALAPPIKKQLKDQGLKMNPDDASLVQALSKAITILRVHSICPPKSGRDMELKIMKMISKKVENKI